jgi:hypothetical protein
MSLSMDTVTLHRSGQLDTHDLRTFLYCTLIKHEQWMAWEEGN